MRTVQVSKAHFLGTLLSSVLLLAAPAAFAQVNHGDFLGSGIDFLQVTETTQTPPDPAVLWEAPALDGTGTGLLFFPSDFTSICSQGSSDITSSQLTTTIMAQGNNTLDLLQLAESGDVTLTKFPPFGDPTTNASASLGGFLTVIEDTGGPIVPVVIPFAGSFVPSSTFSLPGDFGASVWQGSFMLDIAAQVPNATKAILQLNNTLDSNCGAGATNGKIQKKSVGGPSVAIIVNPLDCAVDIEKTCCIPPPPSSGIDQCEGKVLSMKFEYTDQDCNATSNTQEGKAQCSGDAPGNPIDVVITKDEDKIAVDGVIGGTGTFSPGETFVITNEEDAPLAKELRSETKFRIEGPNDDQSLVMHTSCSKALSCGDQFGSVRLVELETTEGGIINCETPPGEGTACVAPGDPVGTQCQERPVQVVFEYTGADCQDPLPQDPGKAECDGNPGGANNVNVIYTGKDPGKFTVSPASMIDVGDQFTLTATGRDELHSATKFVITDAAGTLQTLELHTSCSQTLALGQEFGSLKVVGFTDKDGNVAQLGDPNAEIFFESCEVPLAPPGPHCTSKVMELTLVYIGDFLGEGCTVSNSQEGNGTCTGVADPGDPVNVTITKDPTKVFADPDSSIGFGDTITIFKDEGGVLKELSSSTEFDVSGAGGTQSLEIHTSCSKPLNLGDRFGSFVVLAIDRKDDGVVSLGGEVEYQYKVTADPANPGTLGNVSVDDDIFGNIVSGETLDPGEMKTFFVTQTLLGSETNTATVSGDIAGDFCMGALDTVDVTVTAPPQGSFDCSDAKPIDSLTMTWNGITDVHVKAWDGDVGGTLLLDTFAANPMDPVAPGEDLTVSGMDGSPNNQVWEIFSGSFTNPQKQGESTFHISCSDDNMNGIEDCDKDQGDGKDDDAGLINNWLLEGMSGDETLVCTPGENIVPPACGFGPELLVIMPGLMLWHRRRLHKES